MFGQTGPGQINPWPSLENRNENSRLTALSQANRYNQQLINAYNVNFDAWKTMVISGKIDNKNPPKPPNGFEAVMEPDGWWGEAMGSSPVCAARADIPPDYSLTKEQRHAAIGPNNISIGVPLPDAPGYYQVKDDDTCPNGFVTPPMPPSPFWPPGAIFRKISYPWGGWWMLTNLQQLIQQQAQQSIRNS